MRKTVALTLALMLALCACAVAQTSDPLGEVMPDFTVTTIDGEELTLSGMLAEKELVVLNIFTSWCPPCREEFPFFQAMYEALSDRIGLVAVSAEPFDTAQVLDAYRSQLGLTFPIGSVKGTGIDRFLRIEGYPTTLFINRDGVVCFFQVGAFSFEEQLAALIFHLLDPDYDGAPVSFYGAYVCDQDMEPVPGVYVSYCTDTACELCTSDGNGMILYFGAPGEAYHLQILKTPTGYSFGDEGDFYAREGRWSIILVDRD